MGNTEPAFEKAVFLFHYELAKVDGQPGITFRDFERGGEERNRALTLSKAAIVPL